MRRSTNGTLSVSARNVKGGGAVLVQLDPVVGGTTQLLELKSTPVTPLATTSPVGLAVLRVQ
jgi:hypothetical protein